MRVEAGGIREQQQRYIRVDARKDSAVISLVGLVEFIQNGIKNARTRQQARDDWGREALKQLLRRLYGYIRIRVLLPSRP